VAPQNSRYGALASAVEALRGKRRITDDEMLKTSGSAVDAQELINVLVKTRLAQRIQGGIEATALADSDISDGQLADIGLHLFGAEYDDYLRLLDLLGVSLSCRLESPCGEPDAAPAPKREVDPEVVKRFAKNFIDVRDMEPRQAGGGKAGGK
jgi:hypothetical protein